MIVAEYLLLVLLALISYITYREKNRQFYSSRDIYGRLMAGYACWLLILLFRVAGEAGLLNRVPLLQDANNRYLLEVLFLIIGGSLIALSVTQWVSRVASSGVRATNLKKHLDLLTASSAATEKLPDESSLDEVRRLMKQYAGAISVNYYQRDQATNSLVPAESNSIPLSEGTTQVESIHSVINGGRLLLLAGIDSVDKKTTAILPLQSGGDGPDSHGRRFGNRELSLTLT